MHAADMGFIHKAERRQLPCRRVRHFDEDACRGRSLKRQQRGSVGAIGQLHSGNVTIPRIRQMGLQPFEVLADVRGIHHQHKPLLTQTVDQEVIHHTALGITHQRILGLPGSQPRHIIHRHPLQERFGLRSRHQKLAHMGHIEQARPLPDRLMLRLDAGELHRQLPAPEIDTTRAFRFPVAGKQGGPLQHVHAATSFAFDSIKT
ncbi:hypothetical protein D3C75_906670 [compost metagenome]